MEITSVQNPKIKYIQKLLEKSRERKSSNLFIVEGVQENNFALTHHFIPKEFYICKSIYKDSINFEVPVFYIDEKIYEKLAFRKTTEGIIGIYHEKSVEINTINLPENASILIVESVEKPGNLGAIFRTCEAFKIDLLIICDEKVDVFNPNVIRSSVGCVFNVPFINLTKEKCLDFCIENQIKIYSTFMNESSKAIWDLDFTQKSAVLFGTEHEGVSDFWKTKTNDNFIIPMSGKVDSLNVSNAIAITLYELKRQKFK